MRAGTALTQLVEFSDGAPDGDIAWQLLDALGIQVASGAVTPAADAASAVITVTAEDNTIGDGVLASPRELRWSYTVAGLIHSGQLRYRLEAFLPLGVSEAGVRRKLGLEVHELGDEAIDLVGAYGRFSITVGQTDLDAVATAGGHAALVACDAVEALAALTLLPSLQISLAQKESSGTNQFQRAAIDWEALRAQLEQYVGEGYTAVNPTFDPTANSGSLLIAVIRDDVVTGEAT